MYTITNEWFAGKIVKTFRDSESALEWIRILTRNGATFTVTYDPKA